jgi:tetratricopeptide (TPR) repeat protein
MKRNKYLVWGLVLTLGLGSCNLDTEKFDQKEVSEAFSSLADIESSLNGLYYTTGYYPFLGNYAVALGDMCAGVSTGSSSSGHFYSFSSFTFSDTEEELEDVWNYGYKIVSGATSTINQAKALMDNGTIKESEKEDAYNLVGQCYSLKALAAYYLVNLYALPYSEANKSQKGIIVIDTEVPVAFETVKRGTIEETYAQITKDIASAESAFDEAGESVETSAYYMGPMGLQALKARVYLSLGQYAQAEAAAKEAIALKGKGDATATDEVPSDADYLSMWGNVAINDEDIFTIKKSDDDNLSANSLNTLYASYYATFQAAAYSLIGDNDIRYELLRAGNGGGVSSIKFDGQSAAAVSNIPIFRKSEMALIVAECEARQGNIAQAQNYLMFTAKRDKDIQSTDDLPSTASDLLAFISEERIREFFGEGHRFYDARRMGDLVSGDQFQNWDIQKFVFPIPAAEINTGMGCEQNTNWSDALPAF